MAISNRWVCKSSEEYDLENVKEILKKENKGTRKGETSDKLKHVIRLDPQIVSTDNSNYLSGTLFFEDELKNQYYILTDEGEMQERENIIITTHAVAFWISDNGIFLFRNSKAPVKKGKELLSKFLFNDFDKINNLNYDIESIENDVSSGILQGMWTFCFKDRQGNITSGIAYGENIDNDSIYSQTSGAPRNWIGVEKELGDEIIKISIYRSGTIRILKNFENPTKIVTVFEIIEEFSKYATIP